jgi:hypothetical protein
MNVMLQIGNADLFGADAQFRRSDRNYKRSSSVCAESDQTGELRYEVNVLLTGRFTS